MDDRQENAAGDLGMRGVLYREPGDLREALGPCAEEAAERGGTAEGAEGAEHRARGH
ncbi:hypothetical protein [Streptomyces sp. NPDC091649]|uniref:hypothetical protein n=1 Tax=Streptomyces sp. NPDC091649 TaxID=3366004 RepID=UPI0038071020